MRESVVMLAFLAFLAGLVLPLAAQANGTVPLVLRPGDAIRLEVPDVAALGGEYTVSEDGTVLLPMIGSVAVAGRSFGDVTQDIVMAYSHQLVDTPIKVVPVLRIAVLGEVRQPGLIAADPTYTLADLLAAAGGLTPDGDDGRITLHRAGQAMRISLKAQDGLLLQPLQPGDQLVVARRSWIRQNLNVVIGAAATVVAAAVTSLILR
jgi:protein involved in polysaccharide export with SLBB domain